MNLRNRIKKMESAVGINSSNYCACYGNEILKYEVVPISIEEWKRRFDLGEQREEKLPDFCNKCQKPVDKRFIEVSFEQYTATVQKRLSDAAKTMAMFED